MKKTRRTAAPVQPVLVLSILVLYAANTALRRLTASSSPNSR